MPVMLQVVGAAYALIGSFVLLIDRERVKGLNPVRQGARYLIAGFALQVAGMVWAEWEILTSSGGRPLIAGALLAIGILRAYRLATATTVSRDSAG